ALLHKIPLWIPASWRPSWRSSSSAASPRPRPASGSRNPPSACRSARSGSGVEPTEAGERLYHSAKRMLQIEDELLEGLAEAETGELSGTLKLGASTGPGGAVVPVLLGAFQQAHRGVAVSLAVHDTQTVVDLVAARELELGIVGASRRHRG